MSRARLLAGVFVASMVGCAGGDELPREISDAEDVDAGVVDGSQGDAGLDHGHVAGDMAVIQADAGMTWDGEAPRPFVVSNGCADGVALQESSWTGWANTQYPTEVRVDPGAVSEPIYGQVWREGATDVAGKADGWSASLMVAPRGASLDSPCWKALPAEFNIDAMGGQNDEYWARILANEPGLWSYLFRFCDGAGACRLGDLNGSDDGVTATEFGRLEVRGETPATLRVMTLNLRCRTDDWNARKPLVLRALHTHEPDIVAFQEDCANASGVSQGEELRRELVAAGGRGMNYRHEVTHLATHDEGSFSEGISWMSRYEVSDESVVELDSANFPRRAVAADVHVGDRDVRVYATHFDFGGANDAVREASARTIIVDLADRPGIVMGDLNSDPDDAAIAVLSQALTDAWVAANPGSPGATMPATNPSRRIDYIFVSDALGRVDSASLVDEREGSVYLSDHLGVVATVNLSKSNP